MEQFTQTPIRKLIHDALRGPKGGMGLPTTKTGSTEKHFGGGAKSRLTNSTDSGSSNSKSNLNQIASSVKHGIVLGAVAKTPLLCQHMASYMYGARISSTEENALLNYGYYEIFPLLELGSPEQREDYLLWAKGEGAQPQNRKNLYTNAVKSLSMVRFGLENYRSEALTAEKIHKPANIAGLLQISKASYHRNGYAEMHNMLLDAYNNIDKLLLTGVYDTLAEREMRDE